MEAWTDKAAGEISLSNAARRTPTQAWNIVEVRNEGLLNPKQYASTLNLKP